MFAAVWRLGVLPMRHTMTSITKALDDARAELVAQELRCREIQRAITNLEAAERRLNPSGNQPNGQNGTAPATGLTDAVRNIIAAEPEQVFCTARIREILETRGFDTRPRVFGSALSTVLTRLGKKDFIIITTDGKGNRTYKRKPEMA